MLAGASGIRTDIDGTAVVGVDALPFVLRELAGNGGPIDVDTWLKGTYAPLPTLIASPALPEGGTASGRVASPRARPPRSKRGSLAAVESAPTIEKLGDLKNPF